MKILEKFKTKGKAKAAPKAAADFAYLDLLADNAPQVFPEYNGDAAILHKQIDNNDSVTNVAVVAKYGAGKSSVINTYLKNYRTNKNGKADKNKFTRITLSTFNKVGCDESAIERSILQQLLYSRKKSELPNSKIERTNQTSWLRSIWLGLIATLFLAAATLFGIELGGANLFGADAEWVKYLFLGIAGGSLFVIATGLLHFQKLKRIKYKDLEADLRTEDEKDKPAQITNLINKFVDEVLYFFECVDINLVIFEDLDRLPTKEIFAKLRELNTIINGSRKRAGKVTFLYAVKDDLFKTEEERAKFFEFILPVVPVINPVTTGEELRNRLKALTDKNPKMLLHERFIKDVAGYIPDMRVLKNTFNDYLVMFCKIFEDKNARHDLSAEKLFALCLYKNLFPYDYALLENNKGLIATIVEIKGLREKSVAETEQDIIKARALIEKLKKERLSSFDELKYMFIGQVAQTDQVNCGGQAINPLNITTFVGLNFLSVQHPLHLTYNTAYHITIPVGQTEILTPTGERYEDKEKTILEKSNDGIEKAKVKLAELEKEKQIISAYTFLQIFTRQGFEFCFPTITVEKYKQEATEHIKAEDENGKKELENANKQVQAQVDYLRFLVAQGYIDEHYLEYTSNYKAQLISPKDVGFVKAVQRREQDFECIFDDTKAVINRLGDNDFADMAVLNKMLLKNIGEIKRIAQGEGSNKYSNLIALLTREDDPQVLDAIRQFVTTSDEKECGEFLSEIIPQRQTLFAELKEKDELTAEANDIVFRYTIKYAADYSLANRNGQLTASISKHDDYLGLLSTIKDADKITRFLADTAPQFDKIINNDIDGAIQRNIIANNRYTLSLENLEIIFGVIDTADEQADFYTRNYDYILTADKPSVATYIEANLATYAHAVLLNTKVALNNEPQVQIEGLLKTDKLLLETKNALIEKSNIVIENIADFDDGLFTALLDNNRIKPTWVNIFVAFSKKGFATIKAYLSRHLSLDGDFDIATDNNAEAKLTFIRALLQGVNAAELRPLSIPTSFNTITDLQIDSIPDETLEVFIAEKHCVSFGKADLTPLYSKPKSLCAYLKIHGDLVIDAFDEFFDCAMPTATPRTERQIVNGAWKNVTVDTTYSAKQNANAIISAVIGCKGIEIEIKKKLIDACAPIIQVSGFERVFANYILNENGTVPNEILWQFAATTLSQIEKLTILEKCNYGAGETDTSKITAFLKSLGEPYTLLYGTEKKAYIQKSTATERLLKALKQQGVIRTYRMSRKLFDKDNFVVESV